MPEVIRTCAELAAAIEVAADGDTITIQSIEGLGCDIRTGVNLFGDADEKALEMRVLEGIAMDHEGLRKSGSVLMTRLALIVGEQYGHQSPADVRRLRAERDTLAAEVADLRNQLNNDQAAA